MKKRVGADFVLSVNVTPQLIEAVLLHQVEGEAKVLRRFIRQRKISQEFTTAKSLASALPGLTGDNADYSLEIGGKGNGRADGGSDVTFIASEFISTGKNKKKNEDAARPVAAGSPVTSAPFAPQLAEILDECKIAGYSVSRLAFCTAPPEVSYTELNVPQHHRSGERSKASRKPEKEVSRKALITTLSEQRPAPHDENVVAFVPMTPAPDAARYVGIIPEPTASVATTLETLVSQQREIPSERVMDSEFSAYVRLARRTIPAEPAERKTAIVRVGSEDTLMLFFEGRDLLRFERLRALTAYDSPETICSRVLLQQDEWKIGEIQHLLVLSEARGEQLLTVFRRYYADAAVEMVQDAVMGLGLNLAREVEALSPGSIPALIVGLRVLQDWDRDDPEMAFQLLPKKLRRDQKKFAIAWHTVLMMAALVVLAFSFSWRYTARQAEIERQREEARQNPITLAVDNPALLKMRVDSLKAAHAMYTQALSTIDSLLIGSDKWTRLHERLTRSTRDIGGIWLTSVTPMGAGSVRIKGTASTRTGVAQFVRRHQGSVEKATSTDIKHESKEITVYDFAAVVPVPNETPRVALYLQEVAAGNVTDASVDSVLASMRSADLYAPGSAPESGAIHR